MIRARFLPEAEVEFAEAVQFYERAKDGLGAAFTLEVERTVERICAFPESGTTFSASSRGRITANFPFWVIYLAEAAEVTIIAIAHQRRKPGYWRRRKDAPS
ncbi:MAG: type II toxin-antitoxin system RelE/ParE family toxin [Nitrospirales bacterium]